MGPGFWGLCALDWRNWARAAVRSPRHLREVWSPASGRTLAQLFPVSCLLHCSSLLHFLSPWHLARRTLTSSPSFLSKRCILFHPRISFVDLSVLPLPCFPTSLSTRRCLSILPKGFDNRQGALPQRSPIKKKENEDTKIQIQRSRYRRSAPAAPTQAQLPSMSFRGVAVLKFVGTVSLGLLTVR